MKTLRVTIFFFITLLICSSLNSEELKYSKNFQPCLDKSQSSAKMIDCIYQELSEQDVKLNQAYRKLQSILSESKKKELKNAEVLWLKFRDANCLFIEDQLNHGTNSLLLSKQCILNSTIRRTEELKELINLYSN